MDNRSMPWTTDPAVHAAWQAQVHDAAATPWRWRELVQRKGELFPRFAALYHRLCALPRRVRRRLATSVGVLAGGGGVAVCPAADHQLGRQLHGRH